MVGKELVFDKGENGKFPFQYYEYRDKDGGKKLMSTEMKTADST